MRTIHSCCMEVVDDNMVATETTLRRGASTKWRVYGFFRHKLNIVLKIIGVHEIAITRACATNEPAEVVLPLITPRPLVWLAWLTGAPTERLAARRSENIRAVVENFSICCFCRNLSRGFAEKVKTNCGIIFLYDHSRNDNRVSRRLFFLFLFVF